MWHNITGRTGPEIHAITGKYSKLNLGCKNIVFETCIPRRIVYLFTYVCGTLIQIFRSRTCTIIFPMTHSHISDFKGDLILVIISLTSKELVSQKNFYGKGYSRGERKFLIFAMIRVFTRSKKTFKILWWGRISLFTLGVSKS